MKHPKILNIALNNLQKVEISSLRFREFSKGRNWLSQNNSLRFGEFSRNIPQSMVNCLYGLEKATINIPHLMGNNSPIFGEFRNLFLHIVEITSSCFGEMTRKNSLHLSESILSYLHNLVNYPHILKKPATLTFSD